MVADADDDGVALISLDSLNVLDEESLLVPLGEKAVERRIVHLTETADECVFDVVGVVLAKGDDTECLLWGVAGVFEH